MLLKATQQCKILQRTTLSVSQYINTLFERNKIINSCSLFNLKSHITSLKDVKGAQPKKTKNLTRLWPIRSAIFPLKIAPTIPPTVIIEPKTEYCKLGDQQQVERKSHYEIFAAHRLVTKTTNWRWNFLCFK